jgi:hypothetical protein
MVRQFFIIIFASLKEKKGKREFVSPFLFLYSSTKRNFDGKKKKKRGGEVVG